MAMATAALFVAAQRKFVAAKEFTVAALSANHTACFALLALNVLEQLL